MRLEAPFWWYRKTGVLAAALAPVGALYGKIAASRMAEDAAYRSRLPVICVGNFTAGGGGKTPTAIAVATLLKAMGKTPAFLTRGYGGAATGVVEVTESHGAEDVGDEPLLLAQVAPTFVSPDRVAGAKAIEASGADVIVMDDGFQNPSLAKDLSLVVVDAASGLGNGLVMPAGPLRAPLDSQIARVDALVVIGDGKKAAPVIAACEAQGKPVLHAKIAPNCDPRWLTVLPVIGFAGIARPGKFFATLRTHGARLIDSHGFPDHHRFTERQARRLLNDAEAKGAMLVTTEKDWARLPDDDDDSALSELKHRSRPLPIVVTLDDADTLKDLLSSITLRMT